MTLKAVTPEDLRISRMIRASLKPMHIVPNSVSVQVVLGKGHAPMHAAVVRRDGQTLAIYPAQWGNGLIPSMAQVMKDARWH